MAESSGGQGPSVGLDHLVLFVSDLKRSREFYVDRLGLDVAYEDDEMIQVKGRGDFSILLEVEHEKVGGAGFEMQLLVDDVDAEYRRLSEQGISFAADPEDMYWGARHAFFKDPDDYALTIYRPGAESG